MAIEILTASNRCLKKIVYPLCSCLAYIGAGLSMAMALIVFLDILLRTFFNKPMLGVIELETFMLAILCFFSLAYTKIGEGHVRVDIFVGKLPSRFRAVIDGIFLSGTAQGPKNVTETMSAAHSAAIKAHALISRGEIELEPTMAAVDRTLCEWCGACDEACPFEAIDKTELEGNAVAVVNESNCKGCGMCLPVCTVNAIQLIGFTDGEIEAMIESLAQ